MASKENQEALEYLKKEMGADFIFSDDNISKCLNTLQKAIDRLKEDEEIIDGLCVSNEKLTVESVHFEIALELLIKDYLKDHKILNLSLSEEQVKQLYLEKVKELENGKQ